MSHVWFPDLLASLPTQPRVVVVSIACCLAQGCRGGRGVILESNGIHADPALFLHLCMCSLVFASALAHSIDRPHRHTHLFLPTPCWTESDGTLLASSDADCCRAEHSLDGVVRVVLMVLRWGRHWEKAWSPHDSLCLFPSAHMILVANFPYQGEFLSRAALKTDDVLSA